MNVFDSPPVVPRSVAQLLGELQHGQLRTLGVGPVATGFEPLDSVLEGGFLSGDVVLLGGQPGSGKTLCALQWARNAAMAGRRVTFACFEHDEPALMHRLLVQQLAEVEDGTSADDRIRARTLARNLMLGTIDLTTAIGVSPSIEQALAAMQSYAANLQLLRASSQLTTPHELDHIAAENLDTGGVLFIDYLQKLPIHSAPNLSERVYRAVEIAKELAIAHKISVVALSSVSEEGIKANRLRLEHLRGSDAIAHECDLAILLNHKVAATAERHLKYDLTKLDEARRRTIFSIEKNRRGEVDTHLEFVKDFANFRFLPRGHFVTEALQD